MKRVILYLDETSLNITTKDGFVIGSASGVADLESADEKGELVLNLVKQGLTADEIVKLKNADLI